METEVIARNTAQTVTGMESSDANGKESEPTDIAISTSEETDELVQDDQLVSYMQLRDRKHINKPATFDDYVMMASEMFNSNEPDSYEEAVLHDDKGELLK